METSGATLIHCSPLRNGCSLSMRGWSCMDQRSYSRHQHGEIQAVCGVTPKIEGFFAVCKAKGLTGEQGIIIPATNVPNLMLDEEVIDAVWAGQFHICAVRTIDEGIELLTGS